MRPARPARRWLIALAPWLLAFLLAALAALLPRVPQPAHYHLFADQRACLGLPNCLDTVSNILFLLPGLLGLRWLSLAVSRKTFRDRREVPPYALFFGATLLVGLGSGYYHLDPGNDRLVWDRAAIALALSAWFSAMVGERASPAAGLRLLPWLVSAGLASVAYWSLSEAQGFGDLRPYGTLQVAAMLLVPLLLWLHPARYDRGGDLLAVIGLYLLALLCDYGDRAIFSFSGGLVSGHSVKHVLGALAAYWVLCHLQRRQPLA